MNSRGGKIGLISHHLRLNSHIDQLKEEFILNDEHDMHAEHSETRKVPGFQESGNEVKSNLSDRFVKTSLNFIIVWNHCRTISIFIISMLHAVH